MGIGVDLGLVRNFEAPLTLPSPARGEGSKLPSLDGRGWGRVKIRVFVDQRTLC
jgi:hypothetical protein